MCNMERRMQLITALNWLDNTFDETQLKPFVFPEMYAIKNLTVFELSLAVRGLFYLAMSHYHMFNNSDKYHAVANEYATLFDE
jgi:hypothetical protein